MFPCPSHSYYITCFFRCYQDHGFLAWFIIALRFHLSLKQGIGVFSDIYIYKFTVTYIKSLEVPKRFCIAPHFYLHFSLSNLANHCSLYSIIPNRFSEYTRFSHVSFHISTNSKPFLLKKAYRVYLIWNA